MMNIEDLPSFNPEQEGLAETRRKDLAELLADLVPECVEENELNFDKLKEALLDVEPNEEDEAFERFELNWAGKSQAKRLASKRTTATLVPVKGDGVDEESTQNLLIEGDNLEVLKVLKDTYKGKVDMIYIDPPYNIDVDGVYEDDFEEPLQNYLKSTGALDENQHITTTEGSSTRQSGRKHSRWLSMMYPRLQLMKQLLKMGGVIFVSIDDTEVANLRLLMDEIFGEDNFVAELIWNKQHSQQQGIFKKYHEYILVYSNSIYQLGLIDAKTSSIIDAGALKKISQKNPASNFTFPEGVTFLAPHGTQLTGKQGGSESFEIIDGVLESENGKTKHKVTINAGWTQKTQMSRFFKGDTVFDTKGQKVTSFYFTSTGKLKCTKEKGKETPATLLRPYGMSSQHTAFLKELFDNNEVFQNPKPIDMIFEFIDWFTGRNSIILDCFAGSGTTGHAVMKLNAEDGGQRQYICVQIPEKLDSKNKNQATACDFLDSIQKPRTIAEITKERLRRAGAKIRQEHPLFHGDLGFKVFKLADSTIAPKHSTYTSRTDFENEARTVATQNEERLLYSTQTDPYAIAWEVAIKHGYELTEDLSPLKLGNLTGYAIFPLKPEERHALHQPKLLVIPTGVLNGKEDIWAFTRDLQGAFPSHHFVLWEGLFQGNDSFKRSVMDAIEAFKNQLTDVKGKPAHTEQLRIEVIRL